MIREKLAKNDDALGFDEEKTKDIGDNLKVSVMYGDSLNVDTLADKSLLKGCTKNLFIAYLTSRYGHLQRGKMWFETVSPLAQDRVVQLPTIKLVDKRPLLIRSC